MIYTLQLGKFRVINVEPTKDGKYIIHFEIHTIIGHSILPFKPKLKPGDFITVYTEVEPDAQSSQAPIQ